jgi:hypothetical protein
MKKVIFSLLAIELALFVILFTTGCSNTKRETSDVMHERAVIVTLIYSPSEHHTHLGTTMMDDFNNPLGGTDYNGDHGIKIGKIHGETVQISESNVPERYGVVFQCQHGTFTVEGSDTKHRVLYNKLYNNVHDTVDVLYKEIYLVTYDKDDKTKVVKKVLDDLKFIDAQIIQK